MTPYEVLGVPPDATVDEIRSAYRRLVRDLHPDTRSPDLDPAAADEALRRVRLAWEALTDPHASVAWPAPAADDLQPTERHVGVRRFPWWIVAIAVLMAIFIITAYAGSVPVTTP